MSSQLIKVERHPNQFIRTFHVKEKLTNTGSNHYTSSKYIESDKEELGELATQLAKMLFEIIGVDEVFISKYDMSVTIGQAFDWEDDKIEDKVKEVITSNIEEFRSKKSEEE